MPTNEAQLVDFLLLGGGLASATAAETLRAAGVEGVLQSCVRKPCSPITDHRYQKSFFSRVLTRLKF